MPATIRELAGSREFTTGPNPSGTIRYIVEGAADDVEARELVTGTAPSSYAPFGGILIVVPRNAITVTPLERDGLFECTVEYAYSASELQTVRGFDTTGGTYNLKCGYGETRYARAGETAPKQNGVLGLDEKGEVQGVDIPVPVYQFAETRYFPDSFCTPSYRLLIRNLTGKINQHAFRGFEPGEVLFLGATGQKRGDGYWEIQFRFAAQENAELDFGDDGSGNPLIEGVQKRGWDYLWILFEPSTDDVAKARVQKPLAAYVDVVYREADFSLLGIGTGAE